MAMARAAGMGIGVSSCKAFTKSPAPNTTAAIEHGLSGLLITSPFRAVLRQLDQLRL
jgi:hypothetical protein